jgi:hypothetical protein
MSVIQMGGVEEHGVREQWYGNRTENARVRHSVPTDNNWQDRERQLGF